MDEELFGNKGKQAWSNVVGHCFFRTNHSAIFPPFHPFPFLGDRATSALTTLYGEEGKVNSAEKAIFFFLRNK